MIRPAQILFGVSVWPFELGSPSYIVRVSINANAVAYLFLNSRNPLLFRVWSLKSIRIRAHESYFVDLYGFAENGYSAFMLFGSVFNSLGRDASTNLIGIISGKTNKLNGMRSHHVWTQLIDSIINLFIAAFSSRNAEDSRRHRMSIAGLGMRDRRAYI